MSVPRTAIATPDCITHFARPCLQQYVLPSSPTAAAEKQQARHGSSRELPQKAAQGVW